MYIEFIFHHIINHHIINHKYNPNPRTRKNMPADKNIAEYKPVTISFTRLLSSFL